MFAEKLGAECLKEYQSRIDKIDTQESMNAWMRELEEDLADLSDLDLQRNAAAKVIDISDELVNIVWRPLPIILSGCLLTIFIRVAALRGTMSMSFSSSARSTRTIFKRRRCLGLV
jgi:hypothetical protein